MKAFALIIMIFASREGGGVEHVPMASLEQCEAARKAVTEALGEGITRGTFAVVCVEMKEKR